MVKVVYYKKSLGRRRYRRYLRSYLYRRNKKYANRVSLNYYKAKINFSFAVFKQNNQTGQAGLGFRIGTLTWQSPGDSLKIADVLRTDPEYQLYIPLYDEVRLLGVSVQTWPSPKNFGLGMTATHVPVGLQFRYDAGTAYNNPLMLNPMGYAKKYWRNTDLKWSPSELTAGDVANKIAVPGYLTLNVPADDALQNVSPSWNCIMNIYVQFRKNKNN